MIIQIAYLLLAALALGFLVFIHELAHYLMARHVGMKVEAFSIGFGSAICKWQHKGVEWRLGWMPFGGYVKIAGEKKEDGLEPHEVPGGYFSKKPVDRIKVAIIAPLVNLALAFVLFGVIWLIGGREKPFHDLTNRIGWVDPQSELYQAGIRPGDEITLYNQRKFHGFKDIFQSTMLSKNCVRIQGYHYNYLQSTKTPFDVEVKTYQHPHFQDRGIMTAGILGPANYLIYNRFNEQENPIFKGSPMENSGIQYGDRVIWADGELIFSNMQLSNILNSQNTLLTIERSGKKMLAKIPLSKLGEYKMSGDYKSELGDYKYEANIKEKLTSLWMIPYQIDSNLTVQIPLRFIDREDAASNESSSIVTQLARGDRIIAVDGVPTNKLQDLLKNLQSHKFNIIVQSKNAKLPLVTWQEANQSFEQNINFKDLSALTQQIGFSDSIQQDGSLKLLKPITPMTMTQIAQTVNKPEWNEMIQAQYAKISEISDPEKRHAALAQFKAEQSRLYLGVNFQDRDVLYNPAPYVLFGRVTADIYQTLKALVTGGLHPKWLSGPIGIVQVMQQGWSLGVKEALYWLALISLNLGFLNLLPIPVLDGGQICFALWEQITRKPLKSKTMERIVIPFMIVFIGLFVFVTFHDLSRLIRGIF